ncbi:cytochrome P450 [Amycolatopsis pigmentata]|uniref:Cytochrome P450 n=1 Tax=Amycolatopsis pigmentata TaxID=450801 RepID=A0ABW5G794_9PSEU
MRERGPISRVTLPNGVTTWVLTRHEDIRVALSDPRLSADRSRPGFPMPVVTPRRGAQPFGKLLTSMDSPEHGSARRAVVGEFTVKQIAHLRPRIQQIVDEHIDAMLAGERPTDLVKALSLPVPSLVICELLGVPYADHEFFQHHSSMLLRHEISDDERGKALRELRSYFDDLVTAKEADEPDDLLGRQIRKQREDGEIDHEGLVSLAFLLLLAGHETTANMISLGTLALLQNPSQLAAIKNDPTKTPAAVEELLRYYTIIDFAVARIAVAEMEISGVRINAGEGVVALTHLADHDNALFADPQRLDIDRGARHHLAFGFGPHQCLGQNLARVELQIVFDTLFARLPGLRLAEPADTLPFKDDAKVYGLYKLPVTW